MAAPPPSPRRRPNGWGFEGESFPPPRALRRWLGERLGATEAGARSAVAPETIALPAPASLPELPGAVSTDAGDRLLHARGRGFTDLVRLRAGSLPAVPDAVARPADAAEVEALLQVCSREGIRAIPWGGGTSVTGGVNVQPGPEPAVTVDLERLAGLARLDERSGLATAGAGTPGPALESALARHGLTLGHFPQSWELSTVGGWVVTRASGQESLGVRPHRRPGGGPRAGGPGGPPLAAGPAGLRRRAGPAPAGPRQRGAPRRHHRGHPAREPAPGDAAGRGVPAAGLGGGPLRRPRLVQDALPLSMVRLSDAPETEVALAVGLAGKAYAPVAARLAAAARGRPRRLPAAPRRGRHPGRHPADPAPRRRGAPLQPPRGVSLGEGPGRHWLATASATPTCGTPCSTCGIATDTLETAAPWSLLPELYRSVRSALAGALPATAGGALCHVSHPTRTAPRSTSPSSSAAPGPRGGHRALGGAQARGHRGDPGRRRRP
jgi:alkyldihydroxyacetonephosphate synthase